MSRTETCWRHDFEHREYVCRCQPPVDGDAGTESRQPVACVYCDMEHEHGTACPDVYPPGTRWDQ